MPLGSFRLNSLAKKLVPALSGWASYNGALDQSLTTTYSMRGIHALNDSLFLTSFRDGGDMRMGIWTRSSNTITNSFTTGVLDGPFIGNEEGLYLLVGDATNAYFLSPEQGRVMKLYSITSGGLSASNWVTGAATLNRPVCQYIDSSNGQIVLYGSQNNSGIDRYRTTVSGTSSITATTTTHTYSGITGNLKAVSRINNTQAIAITNSGTSVYAYYLNGDTATQIGSAITSSGSFPPTTGSILAFHMQDQRGEVCSYANLTSTANTWTIFKATTSTFTSYNVTLANSHVTTFTSSNHPDATDVPFFMQRNGSVQMWNANHTSATLGNITPFLNTGSDIDSFGIRYLGANHMLAWGHRQIRLMVKP
jgi:hypothetical protein